MSSTHEGDLGTPGVMGNSASTPYDATLPVADRAMDEVADLRVRLHRLHAAIHDIGATLDEAAETGEDPERTVERLTELVLKAQSADA